MNIWRNNKFAFVAMLVMIIAGTLIGSHNTLAGMREEGAAVFVAGIKGDGIGIQGDLSERDAAAYNMVTIARKYLPEDNAVIQQVIKARADLAAADSVAEKAKADKALESAVKDLHQVLAAAKLSAQDEKYPQRIYTEFRSRGDTISHDPYNQVAADFNKKLSAFPAGLLGGLTGVKPLELFQ